METNRNEFEVFTLVHDILKNCVFILLGALAAAMISYVAVNVSYVPTYTTSATFVVGAKESNYTYNNLSSTYQMAQMMEKILQSHAMEDILCEELGVETVEAEISAEVVQNTNMLLLHVTAGNPKDAYDTIHAVIDHYTEVSFFSYSNAVMSLLVEPQIPLYPDNYLDVNGTMKKAFVLGAGICILLFGLLSYMNDTVKTEREIEKKLDAKSFGVIRYERKYKTMKQLFRHRKNAVLVKDPLTSFSFVEEYKRLASKLEYQLEKEEGKVLVITSVSENEGKSTVAANLAITYAEQGKKVILIDGDIRRPSQFLIFGIEMQEENELGEYLKGERTLSEVLMKTEWGNLFLLGGKNCYKSSTEILQMGRVSRLLEACKKAADIVIVDTPPIGLLADGQILGQNADGVLLVARQNFMKSEEINEILDELRYNHTNVLGVMLNGVQSFANVVGNMTGDHYGHYGHYGKYSRNRGN